MLLFRSEEDVSKWCQEKGIPRRPIIKIDQLWYLATTWYASRMTVESRRPAAQEMVGIFAAVGLTGDFWNPSADQWATA